MKSNGLELSLDSNQSITIDKLPADYTVETSHVVFVSGLCSLIGVLGNLQTMMFLSVLPFYSAPKCIRRNGVSHQSTEHEGLWKCKWKYEVSLPDKSRLVPLSEQTQEGAVFLQECPSWIMPVLGGIPGSSGIFCASYVPVPVTGSDRISSFRLGGGWYISGVPNVRILSCCTLERSSYLSRAFL